MWLCSETHSIVSYPSFLFHQLIHFLWVYSFIVAYICFSQEHLVQKAAEIFISSLNAFCILGIPLFSDSRRTVAECFSHSLDLLRSSLLGQSYFHLEVSTKLSTLFIYSFWELCKAFAICKELGKGLVIEQGAVSYQEIPRERSSETPRWNLVWTETDPWPPVI